MEIESALDSSSSQNRWIQLYQLQSKWYDNFCTTVCTKFKMINKCEEFKPCTRWKGKKTTTTLSHTHTHPPSRLQPKGYGKRNISVVQTKLSYIYTIYMHIYLCTFNGLGIFLLGKAQAEYVHNHTLCFVQFSID